MNSAGQFGVVLARLLTGSIIIIILLLLFLLKLIDYE